MTNNMCNWNFAQGLPAAVAEPDAALRTQGDGKYDPANPDDPLAPKRERRARLWHQALEPPVHPGVCRQRLLPG